jgi:hypothetical protein
MLPKINYPTFKVFLPVSNLELEFRVMTLKEEKIILTAQEGKNILDLMDAMMVCIKNCCINSNINFDKIPFFELQYIYLNLRANSIGVISRLMIPDDYDTNIKHEVLINIENVDLAVGDIISTINFNENDGMVVTYPNFNAARKINKETDENNRVLVFLRMCIVSIFDSENVYDEHTFNDEELTKYIEELPSSYISNIKEFIDSIPKVTYTVEYKNSKGEDKKLILSSLANFT